MWKTHYGVALKDGLNASAACIRRAAKLRRRIVIVTHRKPDGDAKGTSGGVAVACEAAGARSVEIYHDGEPSVLARLSGVKTRALCDLDTSDNPCVILCDASDHTDPHVCAGLGSDFIPVPEVVIDHHEGPVYGGVVVRSSEAGSASFLSRLLLEVVAGEAEVKRLLALHPTLATAWALGAATDQNLTGEGRPLSAGQIPRPVAVEFLRDLAAFTNPKVMEEIVRQESDPVFNRVLAQVGRTLIPMTTRNHQSVLAAMIDDPVPDMAMIGRAADRIRDTRGPVVTCLGGVFRDHQTNYLALSIRTDGVQANASEYAKTAVGGGGRIDAAGGRLQLVTGEPMSEARQQFTNCLRRLAA